MEKQSNKEYIIIGYSGHSYVICDILLDKNLSIKGYCDKTIKEANPYNLQYLGDENNYPFDGEKVFIAIGYNRIRRTIYENLQHKVTFGNAYHLSSKIGRSVSLDSMIMLGANSVINPLATLGKGVIINTGAIIEHECKIGDFVHVAPGSILAGNVEIGQNTFVGAGSVIKEGVKICSNVVIGAGSVVIGDINEAGTYVGIPAKKI